MMSHEDILDELRQALVKITSNQPTDQKSIVIDSASRQRIEKALGRNLSSAEDLVRRIEQAMQVRVDNIEIPLTPYLLDRLKSRAIRVDWEKFVPMTVKRLLEEYVGLR